MQVIMTTIEVMRKIKRTPMATKEAIKHVLVAREMTRKMTKRTPKVRLPAKTKRSTDKTTKMIEVTMKTIKVMIKMTKTTNGATKMKTTEEDAVVAEVKPVVAGDEMTTRMTTKM